MKTRLNEIIREALLVGALDHKFKPRRAELQKINDGIADLLYVTVLNTAQRTSISKAPEGWFAERGEIYFSIDGKSYNFYFSRLRRTPHSWTRYEHRLHFSSDSEFGKHVLKYYADKQQVDDEFDKARMAVKATIAQFRYLEDLVEAWPEIKAFIPKDAKKAMTVALAIPPKQLNAMLGL
jgi:hypothetical protein